MRAGKNIYISLILILISTVATSAQKDSSGVYMTAQDFLQGKMAYAINCKMEKHRINPHDFFNQKCIKVVHRDSVYMIDKKDIYGVRLCDGSTYRAFENIFYPVLNLKEHILIYKIIPAQSPKTYPKTVNYYFSKDAASPIEKLTYENLKNAFPENPLFQKFLHEFFGNGENLFVWDDNNGCYKINVLYHRSLVIQNQKQ